MDKEEELNVLYDTLIKLENRAEAKALLEDLLTYKELESLSQRAYAAKLLINGNTYDEITKKTNISSATLSRVNKCILHGSGGYKQFIKKDSSED